MRRWAFPFDWPVEEWMRAKGRSASLGEALEALAGDHNFPLAGGVKNNEFIRNWIDYQVTYEHLEVRDRPHPYEMALVFDA